MFEYYFSERHRAYRCKCLDCDHVWYEPRRLWPKKFPTVCPECVTVEHQEYLDMLEWL